MIINHLWGSAYSVNQSHLYLVTEEGTYNVFTASLYQAVLYNVTIDNEERP